MLPQTVLLSDKLWGASGQSTISVVGLCVLLGYEPQD